MFYSYDHPSVRFTGRFAPLNNTMTTTAPGSVIEIAYSGPLLLLQFDTNNNPEPRPHLWLQLDNGVKTEAPVDKYLHIEAENTKHILKIIYKGGREMFNRFYHPLEGKISFVGYTADNAESLPDDNRKTIELVGDSITEGVLVDDFLVADQNDNQNNRPLQDDVTATYGWLTAQNLNLKPLYMGYGAVGLTKSGCGGYPKAITGYPYCFDGAPVSYTHPDCILINHGANDRGAGVEEYINSYKEFLNMLITVHPNSVIICLSAFVGFAHSELEEMIKSFNSEHNTDIHFINGAGIIPPDPVHPRRDGHKLVADYLTAQMKKIIK